MKFANSSHHGSSYIEAKKGIFPKRYEVPVGTVLYRFIDLSRSPSIKGADGPWWFEFEHFQTIKHWSQRNGYNLSYAARLFAAIHYEWSAVDAYVRAEVKQPLLVWKGKGKQIQIKDRQGKIANTMTPMQGINEVYQLYIPGMGFPLNGFQSYFRFLESKQIKTGHLYH